MHVQPGYCFVTPCQTDNSIYIVRKEVTPHNGLASVAVPTFPTEHSVTSPVPCVRAAFSRFAKGLHALPFTIPEFTIKCYAAASQSTF
jgi:hypothetical protein